MQITDFSMEIYPQLGKFLTPKDYVALSTVNSSFYSIACEPTFIKAVFNKQIMTNRISSRAKIIELSTGLHWEKKAITIKKSILSIKEANPVLFKLALIVGAIFLSYLYVLMISILNNSLNVETYGSAFLGSGFGFLAPFIYKGGKKVSQIVIGNLEAIANKSGCSYSSLKQQVKSKISASIES